MRNDGRGSHNSSHCFSCGTLSGSSPVTFPILCLLPPSSLLKVGELGQGGRLLGVWVGAALDGNATIPARRLPPRLVSHILRRTGRLGRRQPLCWGCILIINSGAALSASYQVMFCANKPQVCMIRRLARTDAETIRAPLLFSSPFSLSVLVCYRSAVLYISSIWK